MTSSPCVASIANGDAGDRAAGPVRGARYSARWLWGASGILRWLHDAAGLSAACNLIGTGRLPLAPNLSMSLVLMGVTAPGPGIDILSPIRYNIGNFLSYNSPDFAICLVRMLPHLFA